MNQRCNVCAEWPDEMMKAYCVLQEHKAKNRAYREKKRFMKSANGKQGGTPGPSPAHGSAHFMSPSVSSQENTGKTEPVSSVSVLPKCSSYVTTDRELDNVVITVNSGDFAPPVIEVNPPPSVECSKDKIGSLSQGSAGLPKCSVSLEEKEGVKGKGVDDLLTDEQKLVSRLITGGRSESTYLAEVHPQQNLSSAQVESGLAPPVREFSTPVHSTKRSRELEVGSRGSRGSFTSSMTSALERIAAKHRGLSPESQRRKMKEYLNETDPELSSYSSRSVRSQGASARSQKSNVKGEELKSGLAQAYYQTADVVTNVSVARETCQGKAGITVVDIHAIDSGKRSIVNPVCQSPKKVKVTREWARMVQSGGVVVQTKAKVFYSDDMGLEHFVEPIRGKSGQVQAAGLGLGVTPFLQDTRLAPVKTKSPEIEVVKSQSQESREVGAGASVGSLSCSNKELVSTSVFSTLAGQGSSPQVVYSRVTSHQAETPHVTSFQAETPRVTSFKAKSSLVTSCQTTAIPVTSFQVRDIPVSSIQTMSTQKKSSRD